MARTRQRRRKHRGTQAGTVRRAPGGTRSSASAGASRPRLRRGETPPTWQGSLGRAAVSASILLAVFVLILDQDLGVALSFTLLALVFYAPLFYMSDRLIYRRRQRRKQREAGG
jgi:hypothetical protein